MMSLFRVGSSTCSHSEDHDWRAQRGSRMALGSECSFELRSAQASQGCDVVAQALTCFGYMPADSEPAMPRPQSHSSVQHAASEAQPSARMGRPRCLRFELTPKCIPPSACVP
eukprot:2266159-Rhodomonas_salina.2